MTGLSLTLLVLAGSTLPAAPSGTPQKALPQPAVLGAPAGVSLPGRLAVNIKPKIAPRLRLGLGPRGTRRFGVVAMDRAEFLEETNEDIYHENKKNPWHAFALALLPTLLYKPTIVALAWHYTDRKEDKKYVAFFTAIPASGFGSFYSEWHWAGAISMVGDIAGSSLLAWYFYDEHQDRNAPGGSMTKFYAGIGVVAFFWVFDVIMGPVGAIMYNKKLRKKYLSEAPARRIYNMPPLPDSGLATVGPRLTGPAPVMMSYAGRF